jgi:hypothetical protein
MFLFTMRSQRARRAQIGQGSPSSWHVWGRKLHMDKENTYRARERFAEGMSKS